MIRTFQGLNFEVRSPSLMSLVIPDHLANKYRDIGNIYIFYEGGSTWRLVVNGQPYFERVFSSREDAIDFLGGDRKTIKNEA